MLSEPTKTDPVDSRQNNHYSSFANQQGRTFRSVPIILPTGDPVVLRIPVQGGGDEPEGSTPHPVNNIELSAFIVIIVAKVHLKIVKNKLEFINMRFSRV